MTYFGGVEVWCSGYFYVGEEMLVSLRRDG